MKTEFRFYKENKLSKLFYISLDEIARQYKKFLESKDPEWVVYYGHQTVIAFITDSDGLNSSVIDKDDVRLLEDALLSTRHELPIYQKS